MKQPHEYTKRILLAVSGLSPQILTETLYGLAIASEKPFIPTEIHLISTLEGAHRAKLDLLHSDSGKFLAFCKEYQMPDIQFNENNIHVIVDEHENLLDDIRSPKQNEAAADFITQIVSNLTQDEDAAIHVSIAGGRKTMGYYLGYALSLFGRTQDRLSHVLVSEGYEGHPDFYYPTTHSKVIYIRDNRPLDTQLAEISLAEIPFVRLRSDIPKKLLNGHAGFLETINLARKAELPPELVIDKTNIKLFANDIEVPLKPILFVFYCWFIEQTVLSGSVLYKPNVEANVIYGEQFLVLLKQMKQSLPKSVNEDKITSGLQQGMDSGFFSEKISRINKELTNALGEYLARTYKIESTGKNNYLKYATGLQKEQITYS